MLTKAELDKIIENCDNLGCTRRPLNGKSVCASMHCSYCGAPCSAQGHMGCPVREEEVASAVD